MPTYEFRCDKCSTQFEAEYSIHSEVSAPPCLPCGTIMTRLWSSPAVTFNASGFYVTDSKPRPKE